MRRSPGPLLVLFGTVGVAVAQWYLVWLFAREGGAAAVGAYSTLLAIATPLFIVTQLGLRSVFVTIRTPYPWRTYIVLRALGIAVGVLGMAVVTMVVPIDEGSSPALVAAMVALKSSDSMLDLYYSRFQKSRRYVALGVLGLVNAGGTILLSTIALLWFGSVLAGVWASALVSALVALTAILTVALPESRSEQFPSEVRGAAAGYRELVRAGVPLAVAQALSALAMYVPVMLVVSLGTSAEVGVFATASYLVIFANLVGSSVATVVLPSFALTLTERGRTILLRRAARLALVAGIPGIVLIPIVVFFGTPVLELVYGPGFVLTSLELALLAIASLAAVPGYLYSSVLLALNNYRGVTSASGLAVVAVLASGMASLWGGVPAITAGCLALCIGTLARGGGLFAYSYLTKESAAGEGSSSAVS